MPDQKTMRTRCLGGFSVVWVAKLLISPVKIRIPKNDQIWPEIGIFVHFGPGLAGSFGSLLVRWLVVVVRGLYLARHLFSLCILFTLHFLTISTDKVNRCLARYSPRTTTTNQPTYRAPNQPESPNCPRKQRQNKVETRNKLEKYTFLC